MKQVNRRNLLAGTAAVLAPTTLVVADVPDDPVLPFYRAWVAARIEWYRQVDILGTGNSDSPECLAAQDREHVAFLEMLEVTPTTLMGIAALTNVLWDHEGPCAREDTPQFEEECEARTSRLLRGIWRASTGLDGLPLSGRFRDATALFDSRPELGRLEINV